MTEIAPVTTYVPKVRTNEEKRKFYRTRMLHLKKKAKAAAAKAGK